MKGKHILGAMQEAVVQPWPILLSENQGSLTRDETGKEVSLEGLISCYQWFFQHLLNIFSFKAPCLETRGNRICTRC